jgi:hypothetical protein
MTDTRSTGEAPGFTPAALSWRCRSPSHRPPGPGLRHPPGSSPPTRPSCRQPTPAGEHRHPAHISRIEAGQVSRGVTTPVPCVYLPASLTGPAHRAVLTRLDSVAAASTLPGIPRSGCRQLPPTAATASTFSALYHTRHTMSCNKSPWAVEPSPWSKLISRGCSRCPSVR